MAAAAAADAKDRRSRQNSLHEDIGKMMKGIAAFDDIVSGATATSNKFFAPISPAATSNTPQSFLELFHRTALKGQLEPPQQPVGQRPLDGTPQPFDRHAMHLNSMMADEQQQGKQQQLHHEQQQQLQNRSLQQLLGVTGSGGGGGGGAGPPSGTPPGATERGPVGPLMPNLGAMPSPASLGQVHSVEELEARFRQSDLNGGEGGAPSGGRTPGPPNDPFAEQQPMAIGGGGGGSIPRLIMPGNDPAIGAIHPPVVAAPPAGGAPPTTPDGGAVRQQELLAFKKLLNQMSENQMNGGGGGPPPHQPGPPVQQHHGHPAHAAHMAAVAAQHQGGQGPPPHQGAAMSALPAMLQMMHMAPMPHPGRSILSNTRLHPFLHQSRVESRSQNSKSVLKTAPFERLKYSPHTPANLHSQEANIPTI